MLQRFKIFKGGKKSFFYDTFNLCAVPTIANLISHLKKKVKIDKQKVKNIQNYKHVC